MQLDLFIRFEYHSKVIESQYTASHTIYTHLI